MPVESFKKVKNKPILEDLVMSKTKLLRISVKCAHARAIVT